MSNTNKYRNRLITLLKELFQLDQPELDFGHKLKVIHPKRKDGTGREYNFNRDGRSWNCSNAIAKNTFLTAPTNLFAHA